MSDMIRKNLILQREEAEAEQFVNQQAQERCRNRLDCKSFKDNLILLQHGFLIYEFSSPRTFIYSELDGEDYEPKVTFKTLLF